MSTQAIISVLKLEEIQGRGRGLVASQPLKAGQVILKDSPILLYSAFPLVTESKASSTSYCAKCFRSLHPSLPNYSCSSCSHIFCSPKCLSNALNTSHSPWVCQTLSSLLSSTPAILQQPPELQVQVRFLVSAYNLALTSSTDFQMLLSLHGSPDATTIASAQLLHSLISCLSPLHPVFAQIGFSVELSASLLAKDKHNAFGLMHPFSENDAQRSVRAYGIYPNASFFNHDCLPNACRFDYLDSGSLDDEHNTDIIIRMIHDVPQGREICLSYFPVNENYACRQKRLMEDYAFACNCDRCNVESNWSDKEGIGDANDDEEELMDEDQCEDMSASDNGTAEGDNDFPHAYFFLRYMCDRNNCWGTLAPLPPSDNTPSNVLECNVCGKLTRDDGFDADGGKDGLSMEG